MSHLLKKCPNLTQDDRNAVFLHMQHDPESKRSADAHSNGRNKKRAKVDPRAGHVGVQQEPALPMLLERQQSALDTLAEVSRRHLDYSSQRNMSMDQPQDSMLVLDSEQAMVEQALWAQLQGHTMASSTHHAPADPYHLPVHRGFDDPQNQTMPGAEHHAFTMEPLAPSPLVQTANAVNQQLERAHQTRHLESHPLDPQLGGVPDQTFVVPEAKVDSLDTSEGRAQSGERGDVEEAQSRARQPPAKSQFIPWRPRGTDQRSNSNFGSFPTSSPSGQTNPTQSKPRGRFSEPRRKQVQDIRKRGACIRCRMLKKPCSEGTPCKTCAGVGTARLWKGRCLRTRLADEFDAWNAGLFQARARLGVPPAVEGMFGSHQPGYIEARLFANVERGDLDSCLKLAAIRYSRDLQHDPDTEIAGDLMLLDGGDQSLDEGNELSVKIREYCKAGSTLESAIDAEPSRFIRATLRQAQALLTADSALDSQPAKPEARLCYNFANLLIRNALELWIETVIVTSLHEHARRPLSGPACGLSLRYNSNEVPASDPTSPSGLSPTQPIPPESLSHQLIQAQLLAATEARTSRLGKAVMDDLERRLLQRQQVSGFATLIAAVLLLDCVERMTALYHSLDPGATGPSAFTSTTTLHTETEHPRHSDSTAAPQPWSLPVPPRAVWSRGPQFAGLLTMLLHMRGLPPKTTRDENGLLAVADEGATTATATAALVDGADGGVERGAAAAPAGRQNHSMDEQGRAAMKEWLGGCAVAADEVRAWAEGEGEGEGGETRGWRGRFVAGVLLDWT